MSDFTGIKCDRCGCRSWNRNDFGMIITHDPKTSEMKPFDICPRCMVDLNLWLLLAKPVEDFEIEEGADG